MSCSDVEVGRRDHDMQRVSKESMLPDMQVTEEGQFNRAAWASGEVNIHCIKKRQLLFTILYRSDALIVFPRDVAGLCADHTSL